MGIRTKCPELTRIQKIKLLFRLKKKMKKKGFDLTLRLLNKIVPKTKNKIFQKLKVNNVLDVDKFVLLQNTIDDILLKSILDKDKVKDKVKSKIKISIIKGK